MKCKLILLSFILAGSSITGIFAQDGAKEKYYVENWTDNFFISVGAGIQSTMNPDNFDYGLGKSITPQLNLSIGKIITPNWSVRGQLTGWQSKLNTDYNMSWTQKYGENGGEDNYNEYKKNYITLNGDLMLNLTNLFMGYREGRVFELFVYGGPNLTAAKNYKKLIANDVAVTYKGEPAVETQYTAVSSGVRWSVGGSVGLAGKFNINNYWAIDLEARGTVAPSIFGVADRYNAEGTVAITAGVSYTFGGKKFKRCGEVIDTSNEDALHQQINEQRAAYLALENQLEDANRSIATLKQEPKEIIQTVEVSSVGPYAIFFDLGKSVISERGKVNLKLAAGRIKENPNRTYKIVGYTDKTGSNDLNLKLSQRRAQAVYDALINEGVKASQLEILPRGEQENMFGSNDLNRVVILE